MVDRGPVSLSLLAERLATAQMGIDQIQKDLKLVADQALNMRVTKLENTVQWLTRTVAAALISGIFAVVIAVAVNQ
jgi:hypothetical protein